MRIATLDDISQLTKLLIEFRDHIRDSRANKVLFENGIRKVIADGSAVFFISDQSDAMAQLRLRYCIWTGSQLAFIEDIFVTQSRRGIGLGKSLVAAVIAYATNLGCCRVELDVNERNTRAVALYEKLGFKVSNPFHDEGRDLLMRYWIDPPMLRIS